MATFFTLPVLILLASTVGLLLLFVYVMLIFVQPARNSPAGIFITAKRKKKVVAFLDSGTRWIPVISEKEGNGFIIDQYGEVVFTPPKSLKPCKSVLFGVGENSRSFLANPEALPILKNAKEKNLKITEISALIEDFEKKRNPKLEVEKDGGKEEIRREEIIGDKEGNRE